jgi:hypothetical protein
LRGELGAGSSESTNAAVSSLTKLSASASAKVMRWPAISIWTRAAARMSILSAIGAPAVEPWHDHAGERQARQTLGAPRVARVVACLGRHEHTGLDHLLPDRSAPRRSTGCEIGVLMAEASHQ